MVNLSRWLSSVFSSPLSRRRKIRVFSRVSPGIEILENRALLSNGSLVALALAEAPGGPTDEVSFEFELIAGRANFTEFGVFTFDANGTVGGIAPGEDGFREAVLAAPSRQSLMTGGVPIGNLATATFAGGSQLGVYFCHSSPTVSSGANHISLLSMSDGTMQLGWDEFAPLSLGLGTSRPRWFDDAIFRVTEIPGLDPIPDQAILQGQQLSFSIAPNDTTRDMDSLRFQLDEAPEDAAIDAETGLFTWTPNDQQGPGSYDVTVRLFDASNPSFFTTQSFSIVVVDAEAENLESAQLTLYVDSKPVVLPSVIGVQANGSPARAFTLNNSGEVLFASVGGVTLGEFFEIWRTNAGVAGNNPDAVFNGNQLFDNFADATSTVQMFVNGEINRDFDNYIVKPDDEIVIVYGSNPVVSMNTNFGSMVIELFQDQTPITVDNFLNYVNGTTQRGGDYDGTFFHRSADIGGEDFVIQAGGFTTTSENFTSASQLQSITTDPQITNEPGISNLRGTIAMAKLGGNPNSATSQFFVNLSDSNATGSANLDMQNGGFTVFAQVLFGMETADRIAGLPVRDARTGNSSTSAFGELPVSEDNKLAVIENFAGQGSITGVKYRDANQDGDRDAIEIGVGGVTIYIDANNNGSFDFGEISTVTDAQGRFRLQVAPGTYIVRSELSSGAVSTVPTSPESYTVEVELGRIVDDLLFGEF